MITKHELTLKILERRLKANRKEKKKTLDECCATAGYNRKYAIWKICYCICSTRLHPYLPEIVSVLKRHGEIHLSAQTEAKLLVVSRATIDRMLREARRDDGSKIRGAT